MYKNKILKSCVIGFILSCLGLSACLPSSLTNRETSEPGAIYTSAASTVSAYMTLSAGETAVAQLTQMSQGGPIANPTSQESPTSTSTVFAPTETPTPTTIFIPPTATRLPPTAIPLPPTATPVPTPCDWAQFVKDVTIPDGAILSPGSRFTKVWRIRNIGACAWGPNYTLVFAGGDRMQSYNNVPIYQTVYPGQSVDLAVELVAPSTPSHYRGYWMLSNSYGANFGIGARADKPFWVDIQVVTTNTGYAFDFVANVCAANWRSSAHSLSCPGDANSQYGFVEVLNQPILETGKHENEPALWTHPEYARDGWITGIYPPYRVENGDRFLADLGCLEKSQGCDVTFHLNYQAPNGTVHSIASWHEVYDGKLTRAEVDLSPLAGKSVRFILSVTNSGKPSAANAFWLVPSIRQAGSPPPPSPTPTTQWSDIAAVQAARQAIAQARGVNIGQVIPLNVASIEWEDTCLGVHQPGQVCAPAIIPGYRIILRIGEQLYEAHTNQPGDIVFWFKL
jgi:hypothetical protein